MNFKYIQKNKVYPAKPGRSRGFTHALNLVQKKFGESFTYKSEPKLVRGFTVVETLVAIGILSISILATYTAVQSSLQKSTIAKDKIIAFYLAQEAVEYIKNVRDENALTSLGGASVNWLAGISAVPADPCYFGKTCTIDSPNDAVANCPGGAGTCPNLRQNATSDLFGYTGSWTLTNFKREIQLTDISNPSADEAKVTVTVSWTSRGVTRSFTANEIIFSHQ